MPSRTPSVSEWGQLIQIVDLVATLVGTESIVCLMILPGDWYLLELTYATHNQIN